MEIPKWIFKYQGGILAEICVLQILVINYS